MSDDLFREHYPALKDVLGEFTRTYWAAAKLLVAEPGFCAVAEIELPGLGRLALTAKVVVVEPSVPPAAKA